MLCIPNWKGGKKIIIWWALWSFTSCIGSSGENYLVADEYSEPSQTIKLERLKKQLTNFNKVIARSFTLDF